MLKENYVTLNWLENPLTVSGDNVLTIDVIRKKMNHQYKKIKSKNEGKREKEKALGAYDKKHK